MYYRRFGRTGLQMPVLSCGGMRFQHKWDDVDPLEVPADNQANVEAVVRRALDMGVHHFETARGYGTSEMQLGRVLPSLPREQLIVQTKVEPVGDAGEFLRAFETSLGHLKLDHVDLLSLHGINNAELMNWSLRRGGCLDVARRLQREGRCRFVGFSTHGNVELILETLGTGEFDYVNLHWYFVNDLNWQAIEEAARLDMGVFIISPNDKGGKLYEPPPKLVDLCAPLTPMQFNDLYCLARPQVHTLSCGAARPADFDEHVAALEQLERAAEVVAPIVNRLTEKLEAVHGREWCGRWWEGLPTHEEVPGQVNVREILRLWTYARGLDLVEWGRMRYNLIGRVRHWLPGADAADVDPVAMTAVLGNSPFADRIPAILAAAHELLHDKPGVRLGRSD